MDNNSCCLSKIVKAIDTLQKNVNNECPIDSGCDRPFLGAFTNTLCYNTRPITFYNRNGSLYTVTYNTDSTSSIFRVEEVNGCCCKCRIIEATTAEDVTTYSSTNYFVNINLNCICAIKCLDDIILEGV